MRPLRHTLAVLLVATLVGGTAGFVPGAGAQSVESKQAEAERIAAEVEHLRIRASQLDEVYHQAVIALSDAQQQILATEARIAELEGELTEQQQRLEEYAVHAYVGGDGLPGLDTVLSSAEPNDIGRKVTYMGAATGNRQDLVDALGGARASLDAELDRLQQAQADAERLEQEAAEALDGAKQAVADEEALYARVQGELADLVAAEEARRAEQARREAEERARREAEAARAAAPPPAPAPEVIDRTNESPPATPPTEAPRDEPEPEVTDAADPTPTPPQPPPPSGGATPGADAAVAAAYSQLGVPYVWGGSSPGTGFDCSGFTGWAWGQAGRSLPHSAAAQGGMVRRLPLSELLPGDLVFYGWGHVHHVAMYVGGGQIIHAPGAGRNVRIDSIYYWADLHYAGRLP
jgi:peptidoglycan DL-endopeptidase CwlO